MLPIVKIILLSTLLCVGCSDIVYSQNDTRWAVGPDLLSLFNANSLPKYGIYARFRLNDNAGIRIRPSYYNVKMQPGIFDAKEQKIYGIRVGYERTKSLYSKSVYLLYGAEYIYNSDHQFSFDYNNPSNQQSFLITDHKENGVGFFIGCRFFVIPNISLSTESTFQITQTSITKARLGVDEYSYKFVSTTLIPFNNVNLCFHF